MRMKNSQTEVYGMDSQYRPGYGTELGQMTAQENIRRRGSVNEKPWLRYGGLAKRAKAGF